MVKIIILQAFRMNTMNNNNTLIVLMCMRLTQFIPQLPVLVSHGGPLLPPHGQPGVAHELLRDQR